MVEDDERARETGLATREVVDTLSLYEDLKRSLRHADARILCFRGPQDAVVEFVREVDLSEGHPVVASVPAGGFVFVPEGLRAQILFDVGFQPSADWIEAGHHLLEGVGKPERWGDPLEDITFLSTLPALRSLCLHNTRVTDLRPLSGLIALQSLSLWDTGVSDLQPLSGLAALRSLDVWDTAVSNARPLANLRSLARLNLSYTQLEDVEPLAGLVELRELNLSYTQVANVEPLTCLARLETLDLRGTPLAKDDPRVRARMSGAGARGAPTGSSLHRLQAALPSLCVVL